MITPWVIQSINEVEVLEENAFDFDDSELNRFELDYSRWGGRVMWQVIM